MRPDLRLGDRTTVLQMRLLVGPVMSAARRAWYWKPAHASAVQLASICTTAVRQKVEPFMMPAMSPTMEKGNLGEWKVKEGGTFQAGDVLLEVVCILANARKRTRL